MRAREKVTEIASLSNFENFHLFATRKQAFIQIDRVSSPFTRHLQKMLKAHSPLSLWFSKFPIFTNFVSFRNSLSRQRSRGFWISAILFKFVRCSRTIAGYLKFFNYPCILFLLRSIRSFRRNSSKFARFFAPIGAPRGRRRSLPSSDARCIARGLLQDGVLL